MAQTQKRTEKELEELYLKNYKMVYRICFTYMKNQFDAEDCTEDTFVKVCIHSPKFQDENHEKAWLTLTAINVCKDKLKSFFRKKTVELSENEDSPLIAEDETEKKEILRAVLSLPTKYKDVVYLFYYMGYSTDEIAKMLKKPPSTVRNHLSEARAILKEILGGDFNEEK